MAEDVILKFQQEKVCLCLFYHMHLSSAFFEFSLVPWCIYIAQAVGRQTSCEVTDQAPVVQTLDSAIRRINHYPADKY